MIFKGHKAERYVFVMGFYTVLTFTIFPMIFYFLIEETLVSAGNGFVVGALLSVILWFAHGKDMVK
jgi:hypothetical protein